MAEGMRRKILEREPLKLLQNAWQHLHGIIKPRIGNVRERARSRKPEK